MKGKEDESLKGYKGVPLRGWAVTPCGLRT